MDGQFTEADTLLLGRKMYEIFATHWPNGDAEDDLVARKLNQMSKYVASRTLDTRWSGTT